MPNILVVDDDDDIRNWIATVLSDKGYGVSGLSSPDNVVRQLLAGDIDLVLIDYHMPGQDGLSLLRDIRDKRISTPAVMLTSNSSQAVAVECFRSGAADFVAKPIDPDYLGIIVERVLNAHAVTLKNMAYRALGYVRHKPDCSHGDDPQSCNCGLREVIESIQDF